MKIILGSKSALKKEALQLSCAGLGLSCSLWTVEAESGVSFQPVGEKETLRGARNRATAAKNTNPHMIAIGIENGIRQNGDTWEDWAVIVILLPNGKEIIMHSAPVEFPKEAVEEAQRRGFATTTVGAVIAEKYGSSPDDPHAFLTNDHTTRKDLLQQALEIALTKAMEEMQ